MYVPLGMLCFALSALTGKIQASFALYCDENTRLLMVCTSAVKFLAGNAATCLLPPLCQTSLSKYSNLDAGDRPLEWMVIHAMSVEQSSLESLWIPLTDLLVKEEQLNTRAVLCVAHNCRWRTLLQAKCRLAMGANYHPQTRLCPAKRCT